MDRPEIGCGIRAVRGDEAGGSGFGGGGRAGDGDRPERRGDQGGTLRIYHRDSPASMSIHEEGTVGVMLPMMPVFNNLMLFDQHVPQIPAPSTSPTAPAKTRPACLITLTVPMP